ncbi:9962_t:CDS:2, partial [Scutellospora calospora]
KPVMRAVAGGIERREVMAVTRRVERRMFGGFFVFGRLAVEFGYGKMASGILISFIYNSWFIRSARLCTLVLPLLRYSQTGCDDQDDHVRGGFTAWRMQGSPMPNMMLPHCSRSRDPP